MIPSSTRKRITPYLFILLTVYGQVVIKWQMQNSGALPEDTAGRITFILKLLLSPAIISAYLAAFLASLSWIAAIRQLDLSRAYPVTSLSFVLVLISSAILFREPITTPKVLGLLLITGGVIVGSRR
jgi:drug/metabolite transporter (DMT)-like permease